MLPSDHFRDNSGKDKEHSTPEASISGPAVVGAGHRSDPTVLEREYENTVLRAATILSDVPKETAADGSSPLGSLKAILMTIAAVHANHQETVATGSRIEALLSRVAALEEHFYSRPDDVEEQRRRGELIREFGRIEEQLRSLSEKPELEQLAEHARYSEDVYEPLEDLRETIFDYQMVQQKKIYDQRCKLVKPADAAVLKDFPGAKAAEYRHGDRKGCLKGTRGAILDEIELWVRDSHKPPVYWLNGLAGTGKSTIVQTAAERIFADGQLGASFFCSRDFEDRGNLKLIFPTVAVQLARNHAAFRSIFVPLVQSDPEIAHESLYNQMDKLIVRPLKKSDVSTVIVIDALDERKDEEPASAILSVLGQFPRIREGFRLPLLAEATDVFALHNVQPSLVNNDIRLFFEHSFVELVQRRQELDDWPTREQLDLLCERAGGLFIYVAATTKFIDRRNNDPKEQLDRLLRSPESSAREGKIKLKANTTLDSLYMTILQEAFGDDDPEDDHRTRSVLGAVVLAANPLSPSAIATLLGFSAKDEDADSPVRPFHKSFPDFIIDPARCIDERFHVSPPNHHPELLAGCIELMNRTLEKNMCDLPDGVANCEVDDLRERTERHLDPALQYACKSWHKHLIDGHMVRTPAIAPALRRFLEKKFLFWLEVLSVLGAAREAVHALDVTAKSLEASPTLDLVTDCFRFVMRFFEIITRCIDERFHVSPPNHHPELLAGCIELMNRTLEKDMCDLPDGVANCEVDDLRERAERHLDPALQYACKSWHKHLVDGHMVRTPAIAPVLRRFLEKKFLFWLEVLSVLGAAREAVDALDVTAKSLEVSPTLDLVTDCFRFVMRFFEIISTSCPHIYHSALPLCPRQSIVRSLYEPHARPLARINARLLTWHGGRPRKFVTWDLQTGGLVSTIALEHLEDPLSATYSTCGTMFAVLAHDHSTFTISIYNVLVGTCIYSHSAEGRPLEAIWTRGERLRFATIDSGSITTWEVEFASPHAPTPVESLPIPNDFHPSGRFRSHPASSRLAFADRGSVFVWDARNSKSLLEPTRINYSKDVSMSFSSDGRFLACRMGYLGIDLWKESPAGYTLHRRLISKTGVVNHVLISPNGWSIIELGVPVVQLWNTTDSITSLSDPSTLTFRRSGNPFILGFSLDEALVAVARMKDETVVVLDLKSSIARLTIDAGVGVYAVGVAGSSVVAVGEGQIVAWNLPAGDCVLNPRANIDDSVVTTTFNHPPLFHLLSGPTTSVSPGLYHIAMVEWCDISHSRLHLYDVPTGQCLTSVETGSNAHPWFTLGGREVWSIVFGGKADGWKIIEDSESDITRLEHLESSTHPSGGFPWQSPCGYEVTDGGWVLGPSGKWLIWLPPSWRSRKQDRMWSRRFLTLLDCELPEPVILELE
ncbi:hypothetical protein BDM02DRAFT_3188576 [Thelephora ganbajun]|uniref:Uncharacterized protein n=1 Tax=Thelephora ganbajun TaxID=370292 RepID=A0ACB6ZB61_THEGA|nr:hypothetical protein BDM02DRAFT_3188576 [Thelephora ganbajun]